MPTSSTPPPASPPGHTTRRGALVGLSALALALGGCGGSADSDAPPQPDPGADLTLLVYLIGSDLESRGDSASHNIQEMQSVAANPRVQVVLATGGSDKDGWRTVQRKRVRGDEIELLADLGALNMGRQETLQDFVTWGMQTYPAERTLLVLWGHGAGPSVGIGPDEVAYYGDPAERAHSYMPLDAIRTAIAAATQAAGRKLALVGFDTCLMGCVEVAQALAPHADYLVASQDTEPSTGQDWAALLQHLTQRPSDSTEAFGRTMVDAYVAKSLAAIPTDDATLSLTDLRKMDAVTAALANASATLAHQLDTHPVQTWLAIAQARAKSTIFGSLLLNDTGSELADMGLFSWDSLPLAQSQRQPLVTALQQAVVYERHSPSLPALSGLTLYLPQRLVNTQAPVQAYGGLSFLPAAQRTLVARCHGVGQDTTLLPRPTLGALEQVGAPDAAPMRLEAALHAVDRGIVAQDFALLQNTSDGSMHAFKPLAGGTTDRLIDADFMDGWLQLPDANGNPVYFSALPDGQRFDTEAPEVFLVPVSLRNLDTRRTEQAFLTLADTAQRGMLRATGYIPIRTTQSDLAATRPHALPANATAQPLWMFVRDDHSVGWNTASLRTPFLPVSTDTLFTRGRLPALPANTQPCLAALDVRGWLSLSPTAAGQTAQTPR